MNLFSLHHKQWHN